VRTGRRGSPPSGTLELQHVGDVITQPGVERAGDVGVGLEVDLVNDARVFLRKLHGG